METKTAINMDMVNINQESLFSKVEFSYFAPAQELKYIHLYMKILCCARKIPNVQFSERLKDFRED